jgi:hypothetical protein
MGWQNTLQAIRQFSLPRTRALREELDTVRTEHSAVAAELETVRDELVRVRESDTQQITALQLQLNQIESDRNSVRQQAQLLEESLQQANQRQAGTEQRIVSLETQLEEARHQHESNLYLTRDALTRLQSEQQSMMSLQSDMAHTFHEVSHDLLQTLQAQAKPRMSMLQMSAIASLLFLSGALATALVLHDSRDTQVDLSNLSGGVEELNLLMKAHFRTHDQLMELLTQLIELNTSGRLVPEQGALPPVDDAGVVTGSLPATGTVEDDIDAAGQVDTRTPGLTGKRYSNLKVLGFEVAGHRDGENTARALDQFRRLYRLEGEPEESVDKALQHHADVVRADVGKFNIDSDILAAIRLASLRTGVEFSYLMELAEVESSFNPQARAKTSSASGMYQFKDESWLEAVQSYGDDYGLGYYATQVDYRLNGNGDRQPYIEDPAVQQRVLDLRFNPRLSALLAAEYVRSSSKRLLNTLERQPGRAELYLTHFFGTSGAISFLKALTENPDRIAGEIFPGPARRNRSIFQTRNSTPRTVAEVYRVLSRKFNTSRYEEG